MVCKESCKETGKDCYPALNRAQIVAAHRGAIACTAGDGGRGTQMTIELPAAGLVVPELAG
jgi:hypothetical protein